MGDRPESDGTVWTPPPQSRRERHSSGLGLVCSACQGYEGTTVDDDWVDCDECDGMGYVSDGVPKSAGDLKREYEEMGCDGPVEKELAIAQAALEGFGDELGGSTRDRVAVALDSVRENARLREALENIDALLPDVWLTGMSAQVRRIARVALGDQTEEEQCEWIGCHLSAEFNGFCASHAEVEPCD